MSTGAYLRIEREGKVTSVEVEYLRNEDREKLLGDRPPAELLRWLNLVCEELVNAEYRLEKESLVVNLVQRQRDDAWRLLSDIGVTPPL